MGPGSNRLFDEFAKLMTDAAGMAQGVRREAETVVKHQAERLFADMDFVKREEFEVVREMAQKARAENEALSARVAELEAKLAVATHGHVEAAPQPAEKPKRTKAPE
jgi:BMFP domain-containing protein YqiC